MRASRASGAMRSGPLTVALACLVLGLIADALLRHESGITGDERFYERMATHPGGPHNFPYAYRVGVPWVVHILPFSHAVSFTLISLLAIAASGGAMYALLRELDTQTRLAAALAITFAMAPPLLVVLLRHGRSVDPETVLVLTLGSLFIVRRQLLALAITLLAGATVHESCLFLIPLSYAVWARRPVDLRALREVAMVAAVPVALYVVLRTSIQAVGKQYIPGYSGSFLVTRWHMLRHGLSSSQAWQQLRRLASAYGPLWIVAPMGLARSSFARRGLVLVVLSVMSMTFAFGWGRIIFFAAPVFYAAAAAAMKERRRLAVVTVAALCALDVGYAIYMQAYGVSHGIDTTGVVNKRVPAY